ncbi:leucyl aminopeptidase [Propioniciclava sp.]|uniref:leucyl aminopeptidase n=1 Tax=Propioniciclava sp. TaxID=2038686 RepID=UPI0026021368|nr:leucyl aminopeptidase [Propioniciclava sp.]
MPVSPLPEVTSAASVPSATDVVVIGLAEAIGSPVLVGAGEDLEKAWAKKGGTGLLDAARALGALPKPGTAIVLPGAPLVVVVGLGGVDVTPEQARRSAGAGVRAAAKLAGDKGVKVSVSLEAVEPEVVRGVTEGALLGAYSYAPTTRKEAKPGVTSLTIVTDAAGAAAHVAAGVIVAKAVCTARDWVNTPPNALYPETFADEARALVRGTKLDLEVLDEKALAKGGYGGILAVGGGSSRPPRLVRVTWAPRGAKAHLGLVGKGITFDSGGLDIKTAEGMITMKCDMAGAAAVLAAVAAIADLNLKVKVTAYAALAENMPSGSAYRPSDVLTMYGGLTVENANTDAEGRLVMADALARAGEDDPDLLVDVATLTGACMVALGERTAGLMASDDETADRLLDAAEASGEPFWHLPIPEEISENLTSDVADLASSGKNRYGGALTAAAFLREFVGDERSWAHLDIAGPAWNGKGAYDYTPKAGTGFAVRTLVALARDLAG